MTRRLRIAAFAVSLGMLGGWGLGPQAQAQDTMIEFGRDIGPILADTCFKCHGPDQHDRKADLRLDTREGIFDDSQSVVPGDLDASELYQRIISDDQDSLMPPPDSGRKLTEQQKQTLKQWIEQGAAWENHWSLIAPTKPTVPSTEPTTPHTLAFNAIDKFIAKRLQQEHRTLSVPAERRVLIRRVSFDLTGLPPAMELLNRYATATDLNWYESLVDELLGSKHYGEHMARFWLDAARYGDTHGLHLDNYREMWPYRDWVVEAFNSNKSYREFTIEQLAGDLLADPSDEQLIASGFNRAHITTNEGGAIVEEVYVRNVVDRVATTGTVFMGMTVGCAQCHDHKFDPISQKEFYQLFAFFNNMTDAAMDKNAKDPAPILKVMSSSQKSELAALNANLEIAETKLEQMIANYAYVDPADNKSEADENSNQVAAAPREPFEFVWVEDEALPVGAKREQAWQFVSAESGPVQSGLKSRVVTAGGLIQHFFTGAASPLKAMPTDKLFAYVYLDPENPPEEIMLQFNDGNWEHRAYWGNNKIEWGKNESASRFHAGELPELGKWVKLEIAAEKVGFKKLSLLNGMAFTQFGGTAYWDSAGIVTQTDQSSEFKSLDKWLEMVRQTKGQGLAEPIKKIVNRSIEKIDDAAQDKLRTYFLTNVFVESQTLFTAPLQNRDRLKKEAEDLDQSLPITLISKENESIKEAFLLLRGEYDHHGEVVERATPAALPPFSSELPKNRLGLANWLTSGHHPLTARVAVNRYWQQLFGVGLVKTSEDFGAQGDVPSHPELLDWLATDFVEHDWDIRRLMKQLVMSATYRQSSFATPELIMADPENRLLARGPRFRLDAEMLRDQALTVGSLLNTTVGGPGVKPPQPDGLWFAVGYSGSNTVRFKKDEGPEKVHRRSLYTFWKRTAPPPQMNTFDAPSREECSVRRERTNTPLQALLLMNDPQYVEAARHLAQRTIEWDRSQPTHLSPAADAATQKIDRMSRFIFTIALGRQPMDNEAKLLATTWADHSAEFKNQPEAAKGLVAIGEIPADLEKFEAQELASWTMIANLIMNMDEFVTKN